jgi:hypothetical protein
MELTHQDIIDQPNGKVSRLLTLLNLDNIRSSARNKAQVLGETVEDDDPNKELYIRWFTEIADQTNRAINTLNEASEDTK